MQTERKLIIQALKMHHDAFFTPGVYEHSIFGKAALLLEEDAVEVVRCCECWKEGTEECRMVHKDGLTGCLVAETKGADFCSYGERRTDGP